MALAGGVQCTKKWIVNFEERGPAARLVAIAKIGQTRAPPKRCTWQPGSRDQIKAQCGADSLLEAIRAVLRDV